jgi:hypothetical protein
VKQCVKVEPHVDRLGQVGVGKEGKVYGRNKFLGKFSFLLGICMLWFFKWPVKHWSLGTTGLAINVEHCLSVWFFVVVLNED